MYMPTYVQYPGALDGYLGRVERWMLLDVPPLAAPRSSCMHVCTLSVGLHPFRSWERTAIGECGKQATKQGRERP